MSVSNQSAVVSDVQDWRVEYWMYDGRHVGFRVVRGTVPTVEIGGMFQRDDYEVVPETALSKAEALCSRLNREGSAS